MYESYFGLKTRPFVTVPSPETYYPAAAIERARQSVLRLVQRGAGPAIVVGSVGTGKTLLCGLLAKQLRARHRVVQLASTRISTRRGFLQAILFELGLPYRGLDEGELRLAFSSHVSSPDICPQGLALLVDEADRLPKVVFEELRMTTNLVANSAPSVRPVLFGGPHLEEIFADPKLESFNQRLAGRFYLEPFSYRETIEYVKSRIESTGSLVEDVLTEDALDAIHKASYGIPRLINQVCEHALMLGYVGQHRQLSSHDIQDAWSDLQQLPAALPAVNQQSTVIEFGQLDDESDVEVEGGASLANSTEQAAEHQLDSIQQQLDELELELIPVSLQPSNGGGAPDSATIDLSLRPSAVTETDAAGNGNAGNTTSATTASVGPSSLLTLSSGSLAAAEWGLWQFVQDTQPQGQSEWNWAMAAVAAAVGALSPEISSSDSLLDDSLATDSPAIGALDAVHDTWALSTDEDAPSTALGSVPQDEFTDSRNSGGDWNVESRGDQEQAESELNTELRVHHPPMAVNPFAEAFDEEEVVVDQFSSPRALLSSDALRVEAAESRELARQIELLLASELKEMWDVVESGISEDSYHLPESPTPFEHLADHELVEGSPLATPHVVKFPGAESVGEAESVAELNVEPVSDWFAEQQSLFEPQGVVASDSDTESDLTAELYLATEPDAVAAHGEAVHHEASYGEAVQVAAVEGAAEDMAGESELSTGSEAAEASTVETEGMSVWRHVTVPFSPPPFSLQPQDGVIIGSESAGQVESPVPTSSAGAPAADGSQGERAAVQKSLKWLFSTLKSR